MLIIHIQRWPFQPAKTADNELPTLVAPDVLDDVNHALSQPRPQQPVSYRQPPLWGDGDQWVAQPVTIVDDVSWSIPSPQKVSPPHQPFHDQGDDLPQLDVDDEPWQAPRPWAVKQPSQPYSDQGEETLQLGIDDDAWLPRQPWGITTPRFSLTVDDDLPIAPPLTIVDDSVWLLTQQWPIVPSRLSTTTDDDLPIAPPITIVNDDVWLLNQRWFIATPRLLIGGDDDLPITPPLTMVDDGGNWFVPRPQTSPSLITKPWVDDTNSFIPYFYLDDTVEHFFVNRQWSTKQSPKQLWVDDDIPPQPILFSLNDEPYFIPQQWLHHHNLQLWYGEDGYPTPPTPFYLHDEGWWSAPQYQYCLPRFYGVGLGFGDVTDSISIIPVVSVDTLYIVELNIVPSADGIVRLQASPAGTATEVVIRQGTLGFMKEVS